ncbi:MAG TPA: GAF domain-containing protein [Polyangiaceae bacterium]|nr:GAF domain-containing protein [Polyangiaceae bacterium]
MSASRESKPTPPPLWLVTNGEVTVGPVNTNLLVRGVLHDRIPSGCLARQWTWKHWRNIETIREVVALRRAQARFGSIEIVPESERPVTIDPFATFRWHADRLRDPSALFGDALLDVVRRTGACVGAVHRRRTPYVGFVTSAVTGPGMTTRLGHVLPRDDLGLAAAHLGLVVSEPPEAHAASGRIAERLGSLPSSAGVLMIPIRRRNGLEALIELGRPDHPFRDRDRESVSGVAKIVAARLDVLWDARFS